MRRERARTAAGLLLAGIAMAALAGCGQKGPLVLPDGAAARGPAGAASAGGNAPAGAGGGQAGEAEAESDDGDETENRADGR